jgi:Trk K+ transport system NAD-binding subunit
LLFNRILPAQASARSKYVVVGAGKLARLLARRVAGHGYDVVVVDRDAAREETVAALGLPFVHGDATERALWERLEPETIQGVAAVLHDDDESLRACRLARAEMGLDHVVARVENAARAAEFKDLGVGIVNPSLSPAVELEYLLLYPSVSSLLGDLEDEHAVIEVRLGCPDLADRPLRQVDLPNGTMVVLVRRDGEVLYPRGGTWLKMGDVLTLMGPQEPVRELARRCEAGERALPAEVDAQGGAARSQPETAS